MGLIMTNVFGRAKDLKISTRLNFLLGGIITFFLVLLAVYSYFSLSVSIRQGAINTASDRLLFLEEMVVSYRQTTQNELDQSIKVAKYLFQSNPVRIDENRQVSFDAVNQISGDIVHVDLPTWFVDEDPLQYNDGFADYMSEISGATVTVFQKFDEGYLRISTSVLDSEGNRAVGTFIPNESKVVQTIETGEAYHGSAFVVNQNYLSVYEPLIIDGLLQGMIFVGLPESDYSGIENLVTNLKTQQEDLAFFTSEGEFYISPQDSTGWDELKQHVINNSNVGASDADIMSMNDWVGYIPLENMDAFLAYKLNENHLNERVGELIFTVGGSVLLILIIILVFLGFQSRDISGGFKRAVAFAHEMEKGNLTVQSHENRKDEVGMLGASLNSMIERLRFIVEGVGERTKKIAITGEEMNQASVEMSEGANIQASAAEEVSSSMEEMVGNIQQNSDNSLNARENASRMTVEILQGVKMSKDTRELMQQVAQRINVISDISRQTNILALNAAVEAAQAGEHGRGFSVVAAEIRKLAERSRVDSDAITELVGRSVHMSEETENRLAALEPDLKGNLDAMEEIAAASREMSVGADQVNSALMELNRITQQSAAISDKVSSNSTELSSLANEMLKDMEYFKVK